MDSLIVRLLNLLLPTFVTVRLEIVVIHRSDLQDEDDNVEVHFFLTARVHLHFERLSASYLL